MAVREGSTCRLKRSFWVRARADFNSESPVRWANLESQLQWLSSSRYNLLQWPTQSGQGIFLPSSVRLPQMKSRGNSQFNEVDCLQGVVPPHHIWT